MLLTTPVTFFIFNRPEHTKIVFDAIAQAKPSKLLVVADGPRNNRPDDVTNCAQARAVVEKVNWDCEVLRNYSETNMGLRQRFPSAFNWVFSQVEESIVLEDDCLPHASFFPYCRDLLQHYRDDARITSINGSNLGYFHPTKAASYRFSKFMNMWGWATWKRSHKLVDFEMNSWPALRTSPEFDEIFNHDQEWISYWSRKFDLIHNRDRAIDSWDYQWILSNLQQRKLAVSPQVNMIRNIGHGHQATHTTKQNHPLSQIEAQEMPLPLVHPSQMQSDADYDEFLKKAWCDIGVSIPWMEKVGWRVRKALGKS